MPNQFYDPEREAIQRQMAYADLLRKQSMDPSQDGGGYQGGRVFMVGSPLGRIAQGLGGAFMDYRATNQEKDLDARRNAEFDQFAASRPSVLNKTASQMADEQNQWLASSSGNNPLVQAMRQQALVQSLQWPQKALGAESAQLISREKAADRAAALGLQMSDRQAAREQQGEQFNQQQGLREQQAEVINLQKQQTIAAQQEKQALKVQQAQALEQAAIDKADLVLGNIDKAIGKRDAQGKLLKGEQPHPGFGWSVGTSPFLMGSALKALPFGAGGSDTLSFDVLHRGITGSAREQAVQALKGTGQVSNAEGAAGAAGLLALPDISLDDRGNPKGTLSSVQEEQYIKAMLDFRNLVQKARDRKARGVRVTPEGKEYPIGNPPPGYVDPVDGAGSAVAETPAKPRALPRAMGGPARQPVLPEAMGGPADLNEVIEMAKDMAGKGQSPAQIKAYLGKWGAPADVVQGVLNGMAAEQQAATVAPQQAAPSTVALQQAAPPQAIEYLKAHPEAAEQFKAKYGYLP